MAASNPDSESAAMSLSALSEHAAAAAANVREDGDHLCVSTAIRTATGDDASHMHHANGEDESDVKQAAYALSMVSQDLHRDQPPQEPIKPDFFCGTKCNRRTRRDTTQTDWKKCTCSAATRQQRRKFNPDYPPDTEFWPDWYCDEYSQYLKQKIHLLKWQLAFQPYRKRDRESKERQLSKYEMIVAKQPDLRIVRHMCMLHRDIPVHAKKFKKHMWNILKHPELMQG
jgi:hypothetical protein